MEYLYSFLVAYPYLALAQTAFMVWMLVDAYSRGAQPFWFFVIFFAQPIGAWVYFFAIKFRDFHRLNLGTLFHRRASLDELRYRVEQVPTLAGRLALAERLMEQHDFADALPYLEAARKTEPDHGGVLYALARCHKELDQPSEAIPLLEQLLARDARWSNYTGWYLLIEAREQSGDAAGALQSCRELARLSPTLQHQCLLAEHLLDRGLNDEARALLERALRDHDYAPGPVRSRNRGWARQARQLQKRVPAP
jgi:hypothetical protein